MSDRCKFSIILPTKGRPLLTRRVVESVLSQKYTSYELIVVDNDDGDETRDCIADLIDHPNLTYVRTGGLSMVDNWNAALDYFNGEFLLWVDSKTFFYPDALSELKSRISENSDIEIFSWQYDFLMDSNENLRFVKIKSGDEFVEDSHVILENFLEQRMNRRSWSLLPRGVCTAVSRQAVGRIKEKFGERVFEQVSPDLIFALKLLSTSDRICFLGTPLSCVASSNASHGRNFLSHKIDNSYLMGKKVDIEDIEFVPLRNKRLVANLVANDIEKIIKLDRPVWEVYLRAYKHSLAREIGTAIGRNGNFFDREELKELVQFWGYSPGVYFTLVKRLVRCRLVTRFDALPKNLRLLIQKTLRSKSRGGAESIVETKYDVETAIKMIMQSGRSVVL